MWSVQLIPFVSSLFSILEATPSNHGNRVSEAPRKVLNFHRLWVVDTPVCTKYVCVHGSREEVGFRSGRISSIHFRLRDGVGKGVQGSYKSGADWITATLLPNWFIQVL